MLSAAVPVPVRRLRHRGLAPLIALGALVPIACSDRVPRENVVPRARTSAEGTGRPVASEPAPPRFSSWILVQLHSFAVLPAACHFADGSSEALVTIVAPLVPDLRRGLQPPCELAIAVPIALPLQGLDFVVHTRELQVALGAVPRVDVTVVRDHLLFAHGHGGLRSPSLLILMPEP